MQISLSLCNSDFASRTLLSVSDAFLLLIMKLTMRFSYHLTFLRNFQTFNYIFIFLSYYTARQNLDSFCLRKSSVLPYRFWHAEFGGVLRILVSCKVL